MSRGAHLVFLPDRALPRLFLWGDGLRGDGDAALAELCARGRAGRARLVDEALAPREVEGVAVPLLDALPVLAAMPAEETGRAAASVAAWSLAAKLALELVGRERIVPGVVRAGWGTEARFAA